MLTEPRSNLAETGLINSVEPRKIEAYLCLHMGLTLAETCALPMPSEVVRYLNDCTKVYQSNDCFILAGDMVLPAFHHLCHTAALIFDTSVLYLAIKLAGI